MTWYQRKVDSKRIFPIYRPFETLDANTGKEMCCNSVTADCFFQEGTWNYTFVSETPRAVVRAIRESHRLGMKVLLKPHIDLTEGENGQWRGDIMGSSREWWESFEKMQIFWASIAQKEKVEM